jgi:hypothetical protein
LIAVRYDYSICEGKSTGMHKLPLFHCFFLNKWLSKHHDSGEFCQRSAEMQLAAARSHPTNELSKTGE